MSDTENNSVLFEITKLANPDKMLSIGSASVNNFDTLSIKSKKSSKTMKSRRTKKSKGSSREKETEENVVRMMQPIGMVNPFYTGPSDSESTTIKIENEIDNILNEPNPIEEVEKASSIGIKSTKPTISPSSPIMPSITGNATDKLGFFDMTSAKSHKSNTSNKSVTVEPKETVPPPEDLFANFNAPAYGMSEKPESKGHRSKSSRSKRSAKSSTSLNSTLIRRKKLKLLSEWDNLRRQFPEKKLEAYDQYTKIDELEFEIERLKAEKSRSENMEWANFAIISFAKGMEWSANIVGTDVLDGWNTHLRLNIHNAEQIIDELFEKYMKEGNKWPPEMRLLIFIVMDAMTFTMSRHAPRVLGDILGGGMSASKIQMPDLEGNDELASMMYDIENGSTK